MTHRLGLMAATLAMLAVGFATAGSRGTHRHPTGSRCTSTTPS